MLLVDIVGLSEKIDLGYSSRSGSARDKEQKRGGKEVDIKAHVTRSFIMYRTKSGNWF